MKELQNWMKDLRFLTKFPKTSDGIFDKYNYVHLILEIYPSTPTPLPNPPNQEYPYTYK